MRVRLAGTCAAIAVVGILLTAAGTAQAQVFEPLSPFAGCPPDGCTPNGDAARPYSPGSLVLAPDGYFYGTSVIDWPSGATGPHNYGTVFRASPDGTRAIVHEFTGTGAGGCGTGAVTVGGDGAIYGIGAACGDAPAAIYRISGGAFQVVHEFPDHVHPIFLVAGSNGALYGSLFAVGSSGLVRTTFKWDGTLTPLNRYAKRLTLGPDGHLYFVEADTFAGPRPGSIWRVTPDDRFELVHDFAPAGVVVPEQDLIVGQDGFLYGTSRDWSSGGFPSPRLYRLSLDGALTYFANVPSLLHPLAAAFDGSVLVSIDAGDHDAIARVTPDGTVAPVHVFSGVDGSGEFSPLTRGSDGHLYGVRHSGGTYRLGLLYRIYMPSVDVKANGADGPVTMVPGAVLEISMGFDTSATAVVDAAELYIAVITPSLAVYWVTAAGFTATPSALYAGPLPSFLPAPLVTIPDAAVLPPGDYYWVAIVDADSNDVPNGHYVDFVKTTRSTAPLALRR